MIKICASLWTWAASKFQFCISKALSRIANMESIHRVAQKHYAMFKVTFLDKHSTLCVRTASLLWPGADLQASTLSVVIGSRTILIVCVWLGADVEPDLCWVVPTLAQVIPRCWVVGVHTVSLGSSSSGPWHCGQL